MNHQKRPVIVPTCLQCGCPVEYSHECDAYFCPACNIWLEARCGDPACEFCSERPPRPYMVIIERHLRRQRIAEQHAKLLGRQPVPVATDIFLHDLPPLTLEYLRKAIEQGLTPSALDFEDDGIVILRFTKPRRPDVNLGGEPSPPA